MKTRVPAVCLGACIVLLSLGIEAFSLFPEEEEATVADENYNNTSDTENYNTSDTENFNTSDIGNYSTSGIDDVLNSTVKFWHLTRDNMNYTLMGTTADEVLASGFCANKTTKVIIHGWHNTNHSEFISAIIKAYLPGYDYNVIVVDWSRLALTVYVKARFSVPGVGKYLAKYLDFLVKYVGVDLAKVHLVGHSLGAQICGACGALVSTGKVGRITGLDTAQVFFTHSKRQRLDKTDASFVDAIHTTANYLGYAEPLGHVDFYPNGGTVFQPGCGKIDLGSCSHGRAYEFFAESINSKDFVARKCDSWLQYESWLCDSNDFAIMGEHVDLSASGTFYLRTNSSSPYALGNTTTCSSD